jgi:hypothetical protein
VAELSRIFGIGLSRTGTTSLGAALHTLGFRTRHYPHDPQTHAELAAAQYRLSVLARCDAVVDITVAPFYAQLDAAWPGSRFILTVREKQAWLASLQRHWEAMQEVMQGDPQFRAFTEFICACTYGTLAFSAERMSFVYDQHVRNISEYFAGRGSDLLVMDLCAGDGWGPLCAFLDRPIPRHPFPHRNAATMP